MSGHIFQAFYEIVCRIPAGTVATYGQVARLAGKPRCARTVGYAMAGCRDPAVPCHRVIGANGKLVGYGSGLDMKESLLQLEKKFIQQRELL